MEISCHKKGRQIKSIADKTKRNHGSGPPSNFGVKMKRNHGTGQPSNLCVTNKNSGKMDCRKLEIPEMLTGKKNTIYKLSPRFILAR